MKENYRGKGQEIDIIWKKMIEEKVKYSHQRNCD